jgi:hypothetical protein
MPGKPDEFLHGVWVAIEFLVLMADEPTHAREIAESCGIDLKTAYSLSKLTGYRTREMRKFARENL